MNMDKIKKTEQKQDRIKGRRRTRWRFL